MNSNLIVKDVNFEGYNLKSAQDKSTNKIFVGVRWVCNGIGLSKGQMQNERKHLANDIVLQKGERNLILPTDGGEQEILCIDIEFLPLWLAKISITPKMKKDKSQIVKKLVDYQLKAKDVLARAFIYGEFDLPKDYKSALSQLILMCDKNDKLQVENNKLTPKAEAYKDLMTADGYIKFIDLAQSLDIGRTKLFDFLRKKKVLTKQSNFNVPYGRFVKNGCFKVAHQKDVNGHYSMVTLVTPKGTNYIYKLIKKNNLENDFSLSEIVTDNQKVTVA